MRDCLGGGSGGDDGGDGAFSAGALRRIFAAILKPAMTPVTWSKAASVTGEGSPERPRRPTTYSVSIEMNSMSSGEVPTSSAVM